LEAGEENCVAGYFGVEGLDAEFAGFALFVDVALFPAFFVGGGELV
jgi:hypothetical protein